MKSTNSIDFLILQLDEAYRSKAWHGPNLRGSIRGLTIDQMCWRPYAHRHNIWELVVHCAYWKYIVRRRLTGEKKSTFPLKGSNFFRRPIERTIRAWKNDIRLLDEMHLLLVQEVKKISPSVLHEFPSGSVFNNLQTISGIAMHDVYHAGQIQLLKKLQKK